MFVALNCKKNSKKEPDWSHDRCKRLSTLFGHVFVKVGDSGMTLMCNTFVGDSCDTECYQALLRDIRVGHSRLHQQPLFTKGTGPTSTCNRLLQVRVTNIPTVPTPVSKTFEERRKQSFLVSIQRRTTTPKVLWHVNGMILISEVLPRD